jgi:4-hydroxyphenylacetate 3-monooxygenase
MGIRTGAQFLESLRDGREIWLDGERIKDVTRDRRLAAAAHTLAELYDMQHDPGLTERMTYASPSTGERVGLSFIEPRTVEDLVRRRTMVKTWMDATCGMFGRSPDFMNINMMGFASAWKAFNRGGRPLGDNLRKYYEHIREKDLALTHTLVNPQVDRSKPVEQQPKDLAAKIVKETDKGVVINGARMVTTLCAYTQELMVFPSTNIAVSAEAAPYAFAFCIPCSTPGLRFICRPSVAHQNAASPMDYPLSSRLDEGDGMVIFENVLVPWERMFIYRDAEMCNSLYSKTSAMRQIMHQFSTKNLAKAEFMMALGFAIARSTKVDAHLQVQGMLAELIEYTEVVRACLRASETDATMNADGIMVPAEMPLWCVRMMFPKMFIRMCEIIQIMGAGGLVAVPSFAELTSAVREDVATYFQSAGSDSRERIKLFRLAFDAAVSSFSGRQQLYERYYSGDPVRLAGMLYTIYDKAPYIDRIDELLDDLESRQSAQGSGLPFVPKFATQR